MAITFNNASTAAGTAVSTIKWLHTAAGANITAVMANFSDGGWSVSTTGINNVAFTAKAFVELASGAPWMKMFTRSAVAAGNLSCSCTMGGSDTFIIGCVTYNGTSQATPVGAASSATATGTTVNLSVSSTAGALVVAFAATGGNTTFTDPQNTRLLVSVGSTCTMICSDKTASGATTSFSWSLGASTQTGMFGIAISATAVAGGAVTYTLNLLGCGK